MSRHDALYQVDCLQKAASAIVQWGQVTSRELNVIWLLHSHMIVMGIVSQCSLTVRSCVWWIDQREKSNQVVRLGFIAAAFLHVAYKITQGSLTDEMLDVLATTCLQSNDARRCLNARHSSVLSLSQAAMLMKVVANNSRSTMQLIEIELAKAYLHRGLRCKDCDKESICYLANVYLIYCAGQHLTTIDRCALLLLRYFDTSTLVELLQQSAVEHLTASRELLAPEFVDGPVVTTDLSALYSYKCGHYERCLQLSFRNIRKLTGDSNPGLSEPLCPELIQLMDDDIVSLTGLAMLVNPMRENDREFLSISQLSLSLYLMTQCQIKLRHSVASLAKTYDYVQQARFIIGQRLKDVQHVEELAIVRRHVLLDHLVLKFVEQKIVRYISTDRE